MGRKYDLVIFDMDGTLTKKEVRSSWAYVHEVFGVNNEAALNAFINMEITEEEFVRSDIALWKNKKPDVTVNDIKKAVRTLPLIDGIQETIACLKFNGMKTAICSGGLELAAQMIAEEFGFDTYMADKLIADEKGILTGEGKLSVDLRDKSKAVKELIKNYGTTPERTVSVGNSFTDIKMFENTGLSIAFNPTDEYTEKAATHVVNSKNISDILEYIIGGGEN